MRRLFTSLTLLVLCLYGPGAAAKAPGSPDSPDRWSDYLDYAYVYSSSEPAALAARLEGYAREGGITLDDYIADRYEGPGARSARLGEADTRRKAVAYLLRYISSGDSTSLLSASETIRKLSDRLERHENRYWYHYIFAHRALDEGNAYTFSKQILDLWLNVVVALESPYDTYETLSLNDPSQTGFVSALPYIYESVTRIVLLRTQRMGVVRELDPLAAVIRSLHDGRVGAHPEIIPPQASARDYLDRIVARLDGPESDGGSLTFTLALFAAAEAHDRSRELLASQGLSERTQAAIQLSIGAYDRALRRADTLQGQCAVYTRVLRQLGELYGARQRLGAEVEVDVPFSVEQAIEIYTALHSDRNEGWERHGYRSTGHESYVQAMQGLWEEIQESLLNASSYYLARAVAAGASGDESIGDAARSDSRYLSFFQQFATPAATDAVPDSAYFAAHLAARGIGDAILNYASGSPSTPQLERATALYLQALEIFPFDRKLWSSLAIVLERQGRETEFLPLTRPIAERVARSRQLDTWIADGRALGEQLASLRRTLSDDLAVMYFGFADASDIKELEQGLQELRSRQAQLGLELSALQEKKRARERARADGADGVEEEAAGLPPVSLPSQGRASQPEGFEISARIVQLGVDQQRLDEQIRARAHALPLFKEALTGDGLSRLLGSQRDHAAHALVRRMVHESAAGGCCE